jgi:hypothetical protein
MIGIVSQGRMGNQMFQLAFIFCAAKKMGTSYFIFGADALHYFRCHDAIEKENRINQWLFAFRNIFSPGEHKFQYTGRKNLLNQISRKLVFKNVLDWPNKVGEENFQLRSFADNTLYKGFFQSEKYFIEYASDIRKMFTLSEKVTKAYDQRRAAYLASDYIAVHLRRSDYLNYGGDELGGINMTLPAAYYHTCLSMIPGVDQIPVVFVSDDIEFARREFGLKSNYYFESNDEITDFQIMLHAKKVVMANSTFSWWAAWLNEHPDKEVFAPKYFLGFKIRRDYPGGIHVKDWTWVNVGGEYA